jgi:hypothetical protein
LRWIEVNKWKLEERSSIPYRMHSACDRSSMWMVGEARWGAETHGAMTCLSDCTPKVTTGRKDTHIQTESAKEASECEPGHHLEVTAMGEPQ